MCDLFKKAIAEFVGTFVLVFAACGVAGITGGNLVATALTFGLVIVAMAYSVGRVSGCHINPAVSLGCLLTKRMTLKEFGVYVAGQVVGGFAGGLLVFGIIKMGGIGSGNACNGPVGNAMTAGGIIGALLTEIVLTCIFVYVILNVTDEKATSGKKAGIIIGLTLTLVHLIGIPLTGTSVNPARSIATALTTLVYTGNAKPLGAVWIFIVAPMAGAVAAAYLYKFLNAEKEKAAE